MSALSYYNSKARAGARTERVRNEISRSSAYMIDSSSSGKDYGTSYTSSTPTLDRVKRQTSITSDLGGGSRVSRSRIRDHSSDISTRLSQRSSSMDIGAPISVKMRIRDSSMDIGAPISVKMRVRESSTDVGYGRNSIYSNGISSNTSRHKASNYDDDEHSAEYNNIMKKTDSYLTLSKYGKSDNETSDINGMMEEERRSKAYSRIISQESSTQSEQDSYRTTMTDMFANTNGFSSKTINAINKELLHKDDKGPKNYGWRKDMDAYEDNLDKVNEHKRSVRESTRATRDVNKNFKDTNAKIRDYDRETRKNVVIDERISNKRVESTPSTKSYVSQSNIGEKNQFMNTTNSASVKNISNSTSCHETIETPTTHQRGSWRKDIESFEDNMKSKRKQDESNKIIKSNPTEDVYKNSNKSKFVESNGQVTSEIKSETNKKFETGQSYSKSSTPKETPTSANQKSDQTCGNSVHSSSKPKAETKVVKEETKYVINAEKTDPKKTDITKSLTLSESKNTAVLTPSNIMDESSSKEPTKTQQVSEDHSKPSPKWKKTELPKKEGVEVKGTPNPAPTCKKPEANKKDEDVSDTLISEQETQKKKEEQETPKPVPKWKKPDTGKKEEEKVAETPKSVPKWKKSATEKKEEIKGLETPPKPVPKWKKPDASKKEEEKVVETPTSVPNLKKPTSEKKEEVKEPDTPPKPIPKWKKTVAPKKEEEKVVETPKLVPKWKKPATEKKEEVKESETPPKTVPKWKKTVAPKKEEEKVEEPPKPVPKWKKPASQKKEEVKEPETPPKPAPSWKKPAAEKKEEFKEAETPSKTAPSSKKPAAEKKEEVKEPETSPKPAPSWKKPAAEKKEEVKEPETPSKSAPSWKKSAVQKAEETKPVPEKIISQKEDNTAPIKEFKPLETLKSTPKSESTEEEQDKMSKVNKLVSCDITKTVSDKPSNNDSIVENKEESKKEDANEEEEQDTDGMKAMKKEQSSKFSDMDAEFEAGKSKLSALRAKMKALRMKHKAAAEADEAARQG